MAVDGIKISLGEVTKTAGSIKNLNQQLTLKLEDLGKEMNALQATWQSDSSDTIRNNFNALAPRFQEYREVIESYAKFLEETVNVYNTVETSINSNASAFK